MQLDQEGLEELQALPEVVMELHEMLENLAVDVDEVKVILGAVRTQHTTKQGERGEREGDREREGGRERGREGGRQDAGNLRVGVILDAVRTQHHRGREGHSTMYFGPLQ